MSEVDRDAVMPADDRDRLFEHGEHPEPEQINFDDPEVGAVLLVPLDDDAAGHRGGLQRHDLVERARADHHPAAVLAEMARETLEPAHQLDQHPHSRRSGSTPPLRSSAANIVVLVAKFVDMVEPGEAIDLVGWKAQALPVSRTALRMR